jgi:cytochrome c-type biogenesis protein CcmH/NrfG
MRPAVRAKEWLPPLLLLAVTVAVYASCWRHNFLVNWDDRLYVLENEAVRGFSLPHLREAFTSFYVGNYAPLQIVSYMVDFTLWGMHAGGFLLGNIILHGANGLLFHRLLLQSHADRVTACCGAAFFLLHPVQVESVAWVSQRKNVLALFFMLLAFLLYLRFRERGGRFALLSYGASLGVYSLALLTKPVVVILPVVLCLHDGFLAGWPEARRRIADKIPYLLAAAGCGVLAWISQDPTAGGGRSEYWGGSPYGTLLTMLPVALRYLEMVIWPVGLSAAYAQPVKEAPDGQVVLALLLLLILAAGLVRLCRRGGATPFWALFGVVALLPVSQVVPLVTLMNDRYLYVPLLGAGALFGTAVTLASGRLAGNWRSVPVIAGGLLLLGLTCLTWQRVQVWENAATLWQDAVRKEPACSLAWFGLGHALLYNGNLPGALAATHRSHQLNPGDEEVLVSLAFIHQRLGQPLQGRPYLIRLQELNPRHLKGLLNLGDNYCMTGEYGAAAAAFERGLAVQPGSAELLERLAGALLKGGRPGPAIARYREALAAGGEPASLEYGLALGETAEGRYDRAIGHLGAALAAGFRDFPALRREALFLPLRDRSDFRVLMARYGVE